MAVERGKLADLIMDNSDGLGFMALGRVVQVLEKLPPYKAVMAVRPLKSVFLNAIVSGVKASAGKAGDVVN